MRKHNPLRKAVWAALVLLLLAGYFYRPIIPADTSVRVGVSLMETRDSSHAGSFDLTEEEAEEVREIINRAFLFPLPRNSLDELSAYMLMFYFPDTEKSPDILYVSYDDEIEWRHRCYRLPESAAESLKTLIREEMLETMDFTIGNSSDGLSYSVVITGPDVVKQDVEVETLPDTEVTESFVTEDEVRFQQEAAYYSGDKEELDRALNQYYDENGPEESENTAHAGGEDNGKNTASR